MQRRRFVSALAALLGGSLLADDADAAPKKRKAAGARKPASRGKPGKAAKPATPAKVTTPPARSDKALRVVDEAELRDPPLPWRNYELRTEFSVLSGGAPVRLWLPLPPDTPWQRAREHQWAGNPDFAAIHSDADREFQVFHAEWVDSAKTPRFVLSSQLATRDRQFDITRRNASPERPEVLRSWLRPGPRLPTDGPVRSTAERIVGRIKDPVAQGKALYDWVVDNTRFDASGRGTGRGDIPAMIENPGLPGRCADINGLFVALARSIGLPARLSFGLRIDRSLIVASLGQQGEFGEAEHCRAEFYAAGYGWIPVDPADVRKALAEDGASLDGMKASVLRKLLFGFWEPNWIAYNREQDVVLRHAAGPALPSFSRPYLEIGERPAEYRSSEFGTPLPRVVTSVRRGADATP